MAEKVTAWRIPREASGPTSDYAALFEKNPTPLMVVDAETMAFVAVNEAAVRAFGYSASEFRAHTMRDYIAPAKAQKLARLLDENPAVTGVLETKSHWTLLSRDGATLRTEVAPGPILFEGRRCVLLFQPVEPEPTAQEVARTANDLTEFAFSALHDLKEPLHLIKGYLSLLRQRSGDQLPPESREFLEYAFGGTQRMQAIVLNLLEYFRADVKGIAPEPLDLEQTLGETLEGLRLQIQEAGATITHDRMPKLMADRAQMGRVFQNLVSNSLKFRGIAAPQIQIGAKASDAGWEFWVKDNGIGIDPKDHLRVLKPFQRVYSSDRYPGTGLGLSISKKIVELHGGRLWIQSSLGQGASIHFTLPKKGM